MENPCIKCPDSFKCEKFNSKFGCPEHKEYISELNKQKKGNQMDKDKKAC